MGRPEGRLHSKADLQQAGSQPLGLVALLRRWRPCVVWRDFEAVGVSKSMFFLSIPISISLAIPSSSFLAFKAILASNWDIKLIGVLNDWWHIFRWILLYATFLLFKVLCSWFQRGLCRVLTASLCASDSTSRTLHCSLSQWRFYHF